MSEPAASPVESSVIEVSVPLRTDFISTLRTVSASVGADAGFSIDEIDDLRLAISEVVSSLIDSTTSSADRVVAVFTLGDSSVAVDITTPGGDVQIELDDLAASILQSVVDEYDVDGARVTLVKLASETAAGSPVDHAASEA